MIRLADDEEDMSSTWVTFKLAFALFPSTLLGTLPMALWLGSTGGVTAAEAALAVILATLKKSDRKMEYIEVDLKSERFIQDQETRTAVFLPSREDSFDRLCDEEQAQFAADEDTPEEKAIRTDELQRLRVALHKLAPDEAELIRCFILPKGASTTMTTKELADNAIFLSALQMLERMLERKLLSPAEAERARSELKRRLRPTLIYA